VNKHFVYLEDEAHNYVGRKLCDCGATENHWASRFVSTVHELADMGSHE